MQWTTASIPDQTGRIAIVTGANSGIGYETAKALASKGAQVVLACRSPERGEGASARLAEEIPGAQAVLMPLDLADLASVRAFASDFRERFTRLDLLVNNAGVMVPPPGVTADGFETQMGVNHLGHFALTGLLWPHLLLSDAPRVVVVSSVSHRWGCLDAKRLGEQRRCCCTGCCSCGSWKAYGDSKLANLLFMNELASAARGAKPGMVVAAAHPGWTATNLQRTTRVRSLNGCFAMRPWQGALPTLCAATDPEVASGDFIGPDGCMQMRGYPKKVRGSCRSRDSALARDLWAASERLTGVRFPGECAGA
ncbi:oxidoreductase [Fundidesulfovibrio soli]|uniref:oxidoreductase n=1 Tax=Fundidesulfovibrio soli TaxID=2922716 RepID=UPI001FAE8B76|nr:oxidoreductase [Fundidesulfovibrio soli]